MQSVRQNMRKFKRGVIFMFVFFALVALTPVTAFTLSNFWDNFPLWDANDAPPPANYYFHQPNLPPHYLPPIPAWRSYMLGEQSLTHRQEGMDIRGTIPDINESFISAHQLNRHITDEVVSSILAEARRLRARAVSFSFEYHPSRDVVSVVIYANVVTALPHTLVRSVNFCVFSGRLLSMSEVSDHDLTPLAERILAEKIRSNPERYYAALSAPIFTQAFFITDDRLVILFDGFRLSTRVSGVDSIVLNLNNIRAVNLSPREYHTDGPYGIKMIPLREVLYVRGLGYGVRWYAWDNRAVVSRHGIDIIELRPNDNDYILLGTQRRSLEAAPQILFGPGGYDRIYVPITFFDQILPLTTYTIHPSGSITFLTYLVI